MDAWYLSKMIAQQPRDDRRKTPRVSISNLVAELDLLDRTEPVLVCIWDLSLGGACLMIPPDLKLPGQFDLYIDGLCAIPSKRFGSATQIGAHSFRQGHTLENASDA
jgi:hypothetical protein